MQRHFLQIGLAPAIEQRPQQVGDALAQAAHTRALEHFCFTQVQQVVPGTGAMLRIGQLQRGSAQAHLIAGTSELHGVAGQRLVLGRVARGVELELQPLGLHRLACQVSKLRQPAGEQ
ncbi:hypothetical protein D3C71_1788720 [compost metagenome]